MSGRSHTPGATFTLVVPGATTGKGRPRFDPRTRRTYTDRNTQLAEARVERAWEDAGQPRLPDGPVALHLIIHTPRPKTHQKRDGSLSAEGERHPLPRRKPDVDNALKLVMDALNGRAYHDDVDVCQVTIDRFWGDPQMEIRLRPLDGIAEPHDPLTAMVAA